MCENETIERNTMSKRVDALVNVAKCLELKEEYVGNGKDCPTVISC